MASKNDTVLAYELRDIAKQINKRIRKRLRDAGQLSETEENIVRILLSREHVLPSELCTELSHSSQFISQVLNRLEDLGYISRRPSQKDKRKILVSLSARGRARLENLKQETNEWLAAIISEHYNSQQKDIIRQAVGLLSGLPGLL